MDRESDNFIAEMLLKQLGAVGDGAGTTAAGAAVVRRRSRDGGVPLAGVRIVDGSGLSLLDRADRDALVGAPAPAWDDPALRGAAPRRARRRRRATARSSDRLRAPPARGNVRAKTGTTTAPRRSRATSRDRYAFAVIQNGSPISTCWARTAQDRFAPRSLGR